MESSKGNQPASRISKATTQRLLERQKAGPRVSAQQSSSRLQDVPDLKPRTTASAAPRARDPSPSKLPVGGLKRPSALRPPSAPSSASVPSTEVDAPALGTSRPPAHKRQLSASRISGPKPPVLSSQAAQTVGLKTASTATTSKEDSVQSKPGPAQRATLAGRELPPPRTLSRGDSDSASAANKRLGAPSSAPKQITPDLKKPSAKPREASSGSPKVSNTGTKSVAALTASFQQDYVPKSLVESSLELLQLHAIHSKSAQAQREWKESARKFYEAQFNEVVAFKAALNAREKDLLLQRNATAVIDWGSCAGDTLERRLQVLSTTLDEAWQLSGPDGRYTLIVQAFENWHATVEASRERPASGAAARGSSALAAEGLGDGWKVEVESLQENLLEAANAVLSLGNLEGESDLARTIALLLELIKNMLDELELIESIEQSVVAQQQSWVQNSLRNLSKDIQ